jgi:hypothetical protein
MIGIPIEPFGIDHSVPLLRHGYRFWENMRERTSSEVVQTRLLHEGVTAIRGPPVSDVVVRVPGTGSLSRFLSLSERHCVHARLLGNE